MSFKRLRRRPSQATFPPPSLKFRTSGFPQYGFKPRRLIGQPCPAQKNQRLKRPGPHSPPASWFDIAFVALLPSCLTTRVGIINRPGLRPFEPPPRAHGTFAPPGLCCPSPHRYYVPIRQSWSLALISQVLCLYSGSLPDDLIWADSKTFPALGQRSFHTCHLPYAGRRVRVHVPNSSPIPKAFPLV